jgi:hypothetical protein
MFHALPWRGWTFDVRRSSVSFIDQTGRFAAGGPPEAEHLAPETFYFVFSYKVSAPLLILGHSILAS